MSTKSEPTICIICAGVCVLDVANISRCSDCGLFYSGQKSGFGNPIQGMSRIAFRNYAIVSEALSQAMPFRGAKVLDVGCAEGGFTELILSKGGGSLGIEPDKAAAKDAIEKKLPLELVSFESFTGGAKEYNAIVFNDVFEHMQNPISVLEKSSRLLKENGYILINIPLSSGFIFKIARASAKLGIGSPYQRMWAKGLSSPHIYFYNENNLTKLLNDHKFELIDKGRLVALSTDGMYQRVRSTYGPISALMISAIASLFVLISNMFSADVVYFLFKKKE